MRTNLLSRILFFFLLVAAGYFLVGDLAHRLSYERATPAPLFERATPSLPIKEETGSSSPALPSRVVVPARTHQEEKAAVKAPASPIKRDPPALPQATKADLPPPETPGTLFVPRATSTTAVTVTVSSADPVALRASEILSLVNTERAREGLAALSSNTLLSVIAEVKATDMIAKQYFAHVAPDGTDIGALAERYRYAYLRIGENLAMGDFTSSADVMNGWMNSPGHRANILNPEFTEIGISVVEGVHDGRMMWYAVQEFGRPASLCPTPSALLAQKIEIYQGQITSLDKTLSSLRTEIESSSLDRETYLAKVRDYNLLVELYNNIVSMTKDAVATYNTEVEAYNACIH